MKMFVTVFDDADLLPHFLWYYAREGYTQIIIGLAQSPGAVPFEVVQAHCEAHREAHHRVVAAVESDLIIEKHGSSTMLHNAEVDQQWATRARAAHCGPLEWHGIADLDEHHIYKGGLAQTLARAESVGADYVPGWMIDQVASDGSLLPIPRLPASLRETFPLSRRITGPILSGNIGKICLVRGAVGVGDGHHDAYSGRRSPEVIDVLHYKWNANVLERLRRRQREYLELRLGYRDETERVLSYLDSNSRFDIEDPRLQI